MRTGIFITLWALTIGLGFIGFNNCSQVHFQDTPEAIEAQRSAFTNNSGIIIDNNSEFTQNKVVQLQLQSIRAVSMKISNQSDCQDGAWENYSTSRTWVLNHENQVARVYVQFKDINHQTTECVSDEIIHDNQPPTLEFTSPQGAITKESSYSVSWLAQDQLSGIDKVECSLGNGIYTACSNSLSPANPIEGPNSLRVQVTDRAGNRSEPLPYSWIFDKTAPIVKITAHPASLTSSDSGSFQFIGSDNLSGIKTFKCKLDQSAFTDCSLAFPFSGLIAGTHEFIVAAEDGAGNLSANVQYKWVIDNQAPSLTFTQTPPSASHLKQAPFAFEGRDDGSLISDFECRLNSGSYAKCTSPLTQTLGADGTYTFEVRGRDNAGNLSQPIQYTWTLDTTPPTLQFVNGPSSVTNQTSSLFTWTSSDGSGSGLKNIECQLDGNTFSNCTSLSSYVTNPLAAGSHSLTVRATDQAGNSAQIVKKWDIDITLPVVQITKAPAQYLNSTSAEFEFTATDASGISGFQCRLDSGDYTNCVSPIRFANLAPGGHSFFVIALDKAGNSSIPAAHSWNIDLTPPIIKVLSSPTLLMAGDNATISFEALDIDSGIDNVKCGLSGQLNTCLTSATINLGQNLPVGSYKFEIIATDKVGNLMTENIYFEISAQTLICDPFVPGGDKSCSGGLLGEIYYLDAIQQSLFKGLTTKTVDYFYSKGTRVDALINLQGLAVSTRSFTDGFPTNGGQLIKDSQGQNLTEYFAFRLETVVKLDVSINQPGWYQLATISDDGSQILSKNPTDTEYNLKWVDNDGDHSTKMACSNQAIYIDDASRIPMLIKYYQGPRTEIAMSLIWRRVEAMNSPLDSACGSSGATLFYGPAPYNNLTNTYQFGKLIDRGWKVMAATNFIAPPR